MTQFATVRFPQVLADKVDRYIGTNGYTSRADVVKDALRDFFEKYPETKVIITQEGHIAQH